MHDTRGELKEGRVLGEQLLDIAQRAHEPALMLEAHHELWANLAGVGELTAALSLALYDAGKHRQHAFLYGGHDPGVCGVYHAAELLWQLGYPDQALEKSRRSLIMARELNHPSTLSFALSFAAWFHQFRGDRQAVKAHAEENLALASEHGFSPRRAQADFLHGWLLACLIKGDVEAGIAYMSEILLGQQGRGVSGRWIVHCAVMLSEVLGNTGRVSDGLEIAAQALARAERSGGRYYEAELYRIHGELALIQSAANHQQAEMSFQKALAIARGQSAKSLELRAAMSLSRLWQRHGKRQ